MGRVLFWVTRVCLFTQLIEVDRLGSGIRVSARFQIFALTAGWGGGNCRDGGTDRGNTFRGNVLRLSEIVLGCKFLVHCLVTVISRSL